MSILWANSTVSWGNTNILREFAKALKQFFDVKVNALTHNNFINAVWPVAQPVVGEMEMHSVASLATLQTL